MRNPVQGGARPRWSTPRGADGRVVGRAYRRRPSPFRSKISWRLSAVPCEDISAVYQAHRRHADSVTGLALQPWGELAFHAVLMGYRFLIAAERAGQADA